MKITVPAFVCALVIALTIGTMVPFLVGERPVQAQSSTWEVIAQPEQVAGVSLSLVRHIATGQCMTIVQAGSAVSATIQSNIDGLCDTPEEYEQRKRKWEDIDASCWTLEGTPSYLRMAPGNVSSQPAVVQTSKQPGVPK